jgi:DNA-binding CsgD family transcriptional regulator
MTASSMAGAMVDFAAYVSTQPSMDQIAQQMVLNTLSEFEPRAALLYEFRPDGVVSLTGSFGLPSSSVKVREDHSIWDRTPAVDCIRLDKPLHFSSTTDLRLNYGTQAMEGSINTPLTVWPLRIGSVRMGAVQIHFMELPQTDDFHSELKGASTILSLYLGLLSPQATFVKTPKHFAPEHNGHGRIDPQQTHHTELDMTDRQMQILHLLAQGLTNPQIAHRIGYSDSTVRQETMAIYRFLGVHDRRAAARVAADRNLVGAVLAVKGGF